MGVEYDLISDSAREGYELGKGPWGMDEFPDALRTADPIAALVLLFAEEERGFTPEYAKEIAKEIVAFATAHPDWRVVNDHGGWDGSVMSDEEIAEERAEAIAEGEDLPDVNDPDFPVYRRVGSRYREEAEEVAVQPAPSESPPLIRRIPFPTYDPVHLPFAIDLAPGETKEVRPVKAVRARYLGDQRYATPEEVPLDSVKPFRMKCFGPLDDEDSIQSWSMKRNVAFTKVQLGAGDRNDLVSETPIPAFFFTGFGAPVAMFSTSPSAAMVRFTVVNRGTEMVRFTGRIEGVTPSEEKT